MDDYPDLREATTILLTVDGYHVTSVASGAEALALLNGGYRPCAMLLDVVMPEMDGWEVQARMQDDPEMAQIAVIMLSGDTTVVLAAQEDGTRAMLGKPVDHAALQRAITQHARCWGEQCAPTDSPS